MVLKKFTARDTAKFHLPTATEFWINFLARLPCGQLTGILVMYYVSTHCRITATRRQIKIQIQHVMLKILSPPFLPLLCRWVLFSTFTDGFLLTANFLQQSNFLEVYTTWVSLSPYLWVRVEFAPNFQKKSDLF
jgi:hypothetical protein